MFRKLPIIAVAVWGVLFIPPPNCASATTPLTKAQVQDLRNIVQLMPKNQPSRQAHKHDGMIPGDGLATGRASLADLRFNDGSLARVGQEAIFRFLPKTRNFSLLSGTMLLLIPPGNGRTHVNTPSAAAAIRGSALFVHYDEKTDTTVVGALTNSGIQVFNKDASQSQMLAAGQLMVIVKGQFQGLYNFDLRNFYNTSDLVKGLHLNQSEITHRDPAIAKVQAETVAALKVQSPIIGQHIKNPDFFGQTSNSSNLLNNSITRDKPIVRSLQDIGEILSNRDNIRKPVINLANPVTTQTPGNNPVTTQPTVIPVIIQTPGNNPITTQTPFTPITTQTPVTPITTQTPVTPVTTQTPVTPVTTQTPVTTPSPLKLQSPPSPLKLQSPPSPLKLQLAQQYILIQDEVPDILLSFSYAPTR